MTVIEVLSTSEPYTDEGMFLEKIIEDMVRGEDVKATEDYDLFGNNVNGSLGIYLKTDPSTKKFLIYFPEFSEWAEIKQEAIFRVNPGTIPKKNKNFISRVKTMVCTYGEQ